MSDLVNEQNLLDEYKKYDFLNKEKAKIKILVSYIKPSFLFKSEILTPIHLGSAVEKETSKSGNVSLEDLAWLHKNCEFNDNFEGGISEYNRRIGFLTGTYWAWKNYEKLGNPEYFGSFGYRRLFAPLFLKDINSVDIIIPKARHINISYRERLVDYLGMDFFNSILKTVYEHIPKEIDNLNSYLNQNDILFDEIYVMKKSIFFEFCNWIYPIIISSLKIRKIDHSVMEKITTKDILMLKKETRDIAYVMEFLTGYFLHKLKDRCSFLEADTILFEKKKTKKEQVCEISQLLRRKLKMQRRENHE